MRIDDFAPDIAFDEVAREKAFERVPRLDYLAF
jgi:hypothetical protein